MSAMNRCSCNGALHMAEGGSVDDDLSKPSFRKPLIGKRNRQDREGAKEAPLSMGRGIIAGALGLPGDLESLGRWGAGKLGANVDPYSAIPTSEFWNEYLPLRASESPGRGSWEGAGNMVAPGPLSMATKGIRASAPAAKAVAREFAPQAQRMLESLPGAQPAYAVKPPGGNWISGPHVDPNTGSFMFPPELATEMVMGPEYKRGLHPEVEKWTKRVIPKYIKNELGTAFDPLTKRFYDKEGHLSTGDLEGRTTQWAEDNLTKQNRFGEDVPVDVHGEELPNVGLDEPWYNSKKTQHLGYHNDEAGEQLVRAAGEKSTRPANIPPDVKSPWERISDETIRTTSVNRLPDHLYQPWMEKLDENAPIYGVNFDSPGSAGLVDLSLDRMVRYMDDAVNRHTALAREAADPNRYQGPLSLQEQKLRQAGVTLDPSHLPKTSIDAVSALAGRAHDATMTGKYQHDALQGNKPFRAYDTPEGHHWTELNPKALEGHGMVQDLCVGSECVGHPSAVRAGDERVMSLQDRAGNVHGTASFEKMDSEDIFKAMSPEQQRVVTETYLGVPSTYNQLDYTDLIDLRKAFRQYNVSESNSLFYPRWVPSEVKGRHNLELPPEYQKFGRDLLSQFPYVDSFSDAKNVGYGHSGYGRYWMPGEFEETAKKYGRAPTTKGGTPMSFDFWKMAPSEFMKTMKDPESGAILQQMPLDQKPWSNDADVPIKPDPNDYAEGGRVDFEDGGSVGDGDGLDAPAFDPAPPDATFDPGAPAFDPGTVDNAGVDVGFVDAPSAPVGVDLGDIGSMGGMNGITGFDLAEEGVPQNGVFTNPSATQSGGKNGFFGLQGVEAFLAQQGLSLAGKAFPGVSTAVNLVNAVNNQNSAQAASPILGLIGGAIAGPFGAVIGSMAGHALGSMPGVPATSVPHDQSSSMSFEPGVVAQSPVIAALPDVPKDDIASARYFTERANQATPRLSSVMMAKGGRVRGPLSY